MVPRLFLAAAEPPATPAALGTPSATTAAIVAIRHQSFGLPCIGALPPCGSTRPRLSRGSSRRPSTRAHATTTRPGESACLSDTKTPPRSGSSPPGGRRRLVAADEPATELREQRFVARVPATRREA